MKPPIKPRSRRKPPAIPFPDEEYALQKAAEVVRQNPRYGSFDHDFAEFKIVLLMMRSDLPEARAAISAGEKYRRKRTQENHEAYGDRFLEFVKVVFAPGTDPAGDELDRRLFHEVVEPGSELNCALLFRVSSCLIQVALQGRIPNRRKNMQANEVLTLVRRGVAGRSKVVHFASFKPNYRRHRNHTRNEKLQAELTAISNQDIGFRLPSSRGFPVKSDLRSNRLSFKSAALSEDPNRTDEVTPGLLLGRDNAEQRLCIFWPSRS